MSPPHALPPDYLERVYAGVLGKLIGVYLGRPIEGWTHERILAELGPVRYYVNERVGRGDLPLVVTDDDVSGTFAFVRALEEHLPPPSSSSPPHPSPGAPAPVTAEQIGKTWLNAVVPRRAVFWWGGRGVSTEQTAFLNLRRGVRAPRSGSAALNGRTISEQIGGQIFADAWALAAPGNPALAAELAAAGASVSHDGEAVYAARLWAAAEAEAFLSADPQRLLDTGLRFVPRDSLIARLVADVRAWHARDAPDWRRTRSRIEVKYGYDKFPGACHVVPNHAVMVMALLYGAGSFDEALHVTATSGWDTDCNAGNVGCLLGIMHGIAAFSSKGGGPDWRGPLADRALLSTADGGYSVNNAARLAYDVANLGRRLAGVPEPFAAPKDGAQFHFTLPGSVQGFQASRVGGELGAPDPVVRVEQDIDKENSNRPGLAIRLQGLADNGAAVHIVTPTFAPPEARRMPFYELLSSPLVCPGQTIRAGVRADGANTSGAWVSLMLRVYTPEDELEDLVADRVVVLAPGASDVLEWTVPTSLGCRPVQAVGVAVSNGNSYDGSAEAAARLTGTIWLSYLRYAGTPTLDLSPRVEDDDNGLHDSFFKASFVSSASDFYFMGGRFVVAQDGDDAEGLVVYGTREWTDYRVATRLVVNLASGPVGVVARVRGLNRWYGVLLSPDDGSDGDTTDGHALRGKRVVLVKALDEQRIELEAADFDWALDVPYTISVEISGDMLRARIAAASGDEDQNQIELSARDAQYSGGGAGLLVRDGSILADGIHVSPLEINLAGYVGS
ncbi:ADP-ribosylation/Crystallin J1 [Durotheca rogersii]|uniref:ADP-ribosylation/Crystallin J1 n=1 Tax=Durotheca rogersii TaxID=419775 RepID=UPI0022200271|nr:ADP-ribosylation/Crystallin J1 [Durotheca rogersii]KAI5859867.1 ADP-ribosylation/Crystallin J1 [Durotheca rogersii]